MQVLPSRQPTPAGRAGPPATCSTNIGAKQRHAAASRAAPAAPGRRCAPPPASASRPPAPWPAPAPPPPRSVASAAVRGAAVGGSPVIRPVAASNGASMSPPTPTATSSWRISALTLRQAMTQRVGLAEHHHAQAADHADRQPSRRSPTAARPRQTHPLQHRRRAGVEHERQQPGQHQRHQQFAPQIQRHSPPPCRRPSPPPRATGPACLRPPHPSRALSQGPWFTFIDLPPDRKRASVTLKRKMKRPRRLRGAIKPLWEEPP